MAVATEAGNEAMQQYSLRMQAGEQEVHGFERKAYKWAAGYAEVAPASAKELRSELSQEIVSQKAIYRDEVPLCGHCSLPLGELVYGDEGSAVHGECLAQMALQDAKNEQEAAMRRAREEKEARHVEYQIGWKVEEVPRNLGPLGKLGFKEIPEGCAVCLVYDEASHSVGLAPTMEPMAAVNLEYLSIALKTRQQHGREPVFSLDAVDATQMNSLQRKVYEPEWLAGTSVGELMFQADYHLKELSMGEYDQPIVGMKSCFDFADMEGFGTEWSAREWFVMRKAEIHASEDDVLIPFVKMGVEAREQVLKDGNLEDAPLTRPNHPLVKYAEQFTHNFDLIAERKSVIYHLRELAKASVLAKFLVDGGVRLDSSWFDLAAEVKDAGIMEIPQLWNERHTTQIQMEGGKVLDGMSTGRNVMGGVDFGLDRFSVAAPRVGAMGAVAARLGPRAAARVGPMGRAPSLTFGGPARAVAQTLSGVAGVSGSLRAVAGPSAVFSGRSAMAPRIGGFAPRLSGFAASRLTTPQGSLRAVAGPSSVFSGRAAMAPRLGGFAPRLSGFAASRLTTPQGVDLNLDDFSLSEPTRVASEAVAGSWGSKATIADISKDFFSMLAKSDSVFTEDDKKLLRSVFNPHLSDRHEDGEFFLAPDTHSSHVSKLRNLVKEEESVRSRRVEHFCSTGFVMGDAGPLFPASWTSEFEIKQGLRAKKALFASSAGILEPRPECVAAAHMFDRALETATPIFEMRTEDGMCFRIYRVGSMEIRTTEAYDGAEAVEAVFSVRTAERHASLKGMKDSEQIVRVTEYVEHVHGDGKCHTYVVLETEEGNLVVTERLSNGKPAWQENPADLEDRNSLAKVMRTARCAGCTVSHMRGHFREYSAQGIYNRAMLSASE